jgi:hypothetical protein
MIMTNKIVAVGLVAALIGASLGAAVMHSRDSRVADTTTTASDTTSPIDNTGYARDVKYTPGSEPSVPAEFKTTEEQNAYKIGFTDGFQSCGESRDFRTSRSGVRYSYGSTASSRRVYYDYGRPRGRSFWQKHRDKLTLAIGTGAGALIGGLAGGKKWAGIGALAGLGGSALYTYKLRHRHHRYRY